MYNRREDTRLRITSPAVTRRQFRSRETQSAVYNDDPWLWDHRLRSRDPSPGGPGRLSSSAPPGGESYLFSRRSRDGRSLDHVNLYGYPPSGPSYVTPTGGRTIVTSAKDPPPPPPAPRKNRPVTASARLVNGDAWSPPSRGGRPRSFPEPRGAYLSDYGSEARDYGRQDGPGRRHHQDCGSGARDYAWAEGGSGRRKQQGGGSPFDPLSPNSGETMNVLREGMSRLGVGSEEVQEGSFTCDDGYTWHSTLTCLTCYLCAQLYRRPRILPCGHTFCSECLAQLKDESVREARRIPTGHGSCTVSDSRHTVDVGLQFVCPMPECRYSMRLVNLSKWATRNKTVAETVEALRRIHENRQEACTQTDITMDSLLVTIPRSFIPGAGHHDTPSPGSERALVRRSSSSFVDSVVHRALSMDSLSRSYIPQQHGTWRSYAAMLGMHILQQALHT